MPYGGLANSLLCSLVNPRANQPDLLGRKSFGWRAKATGTTGPDRTARTIRRVAATWTAWTTVATWSAFGWHGHIVVDLSGRRDQQNLLAITGNHDFAILAAFERGIEAVQPQIALCPFLSVTSKTRGLQERANVFRVSKVLFVGGGREFAEVQLGDVPLVGGQNRRTRNREAKENE